MDKLVKKWLTFIVLFASFNSLALFLMKVPPEKIVVQVLVSTLVAGGLLWWINRKKII